MLSYNLSLIKPGIIIGNLVSMYGGFFFSSKEIINYSLLFYISLGLFLVISSSCILNNILDHDLDKVMFRTRNRIFVVNSDISFTTYKLCSFFLGLFGFICFYVCSNFLTVLLVFVAYCDYIILYTYCFKRSTRYSTYIGGIAGAMPPIIGYCSVSNELDLCACMLYTIYFVWQIPHFYSIGILNFKDYKTANIPIYPIKCGKKLTKLHILLFTLFFLIISSLFNYFNKISNFAVISNFLLCTIWLFNTIFDFLEYSSLNFTRNSFFLSILVILNFSINISCFFI